MPTTPSHTHIQSSFCKSQIHFKHFPQPKIVKICFYLKTFKYAGYTGIGIIFKNKTKYTIPRSATIFFKD